MSENFHPTVGELIEAAQEKPIRLSVPLPSSVALDDCEVIARYVEDMIADRLADWVDSNA